MTDIDSRTCRWMACLVLAVGLTATATAPGLAGELEPPVPPGTPTMKPLNELEPRRPIMAAMLPLTITEAGSSWYFAEDITTDGAGITVQTERVTIDLMGFSLVGGSGVGINADTSSGLTVRNGTLQGWAATCLLSGNSARVEDLRVLSCGGSGISTGYDSLVLDTVSSWNSVHGIIVKAGSVVRGCRADYNDENGVWAEEQASFVGALVTGCMVGWNTKNGIRVDGHSTVIDNQVHHNGNPDKAGIWIVGNRNRIEGNTVLNNNTGIDLDGSNNMIARNLVGASLVSNFDIDYMALLNMITISQIWSTTPHDPWANIEIP